MKSQRLMEAEATAARARARADETYQTWYVAAMKATNDGQPGTEAKWGPIRAMARMAVQSWDEWVQASFQPALVRAEEWREVLG